MTHSPLQRDALRDLVSRFVDAFNRGDLDGTMAYFSDDALYVEFNGTAHRGKAAVREAFVPQFRGDFGDIRFSMLDVVVDEPAQKALVRWICRLGEKPGGWHGLDVLHFEGGLVKEKLTYARCQVPLVERTALE